ncbi:hypothetical protein F01_520111 [Burkholderia cenocepacia]|nr:hypothetical protein F01_520111 [Burkholderia cenocepacia]
MALRDRENGVALRADRCADQAGRSRVSAAGARPHRSVQLGQDDPCRGSRPGAVRRRGWPVTRERVRSVSAAPYLGMIVGTGGGRYAVRNPVAFPALPASVASRETLCARQDGLHHRR